MKRSAKKLISQALLAVLLAPLVFAVSAPHASACSLVPRTQVRPADLIAADFNQPDSELMQSYLNESNNDGRPFTIEGAYLLQTVLTVERDGDWERGSVSAVLQTWGEQPATTGPRKFDSQRYNDDDSCGPFPGPRLGHRWIQLITSPQTSGGGINFPLDSDNEQEALDALATALGVPASIERDIAEEERLLGLLQDQRSTGLPLPLLIAGGAVAVGLAGLLTYRTRRSDDASLEF